MKNLKSRAYDLLVVIQNAQVELQKIYAEMAKLSQPPVEEKTQDI